MTDIERRVDELIALIQPGDWLTLWNGDRNEAASVCETTRRKGPCEKLVSVRVPVEIDGQTQRCFIPVQVWGVHQVERGGKVLWSLTGERTPIQMEMF